MRSGSGGGGRGDRGPRRRRRLLGALLGAGLLMGVAGAGFLHLTRPFEPSPFPPLPTGVPGDASGSGAVPPAALYPGDPPGWDDPRRPVLLPFHLAVDPMEHLLLLNIEDDPDRVYRGFEPQSFDDPVHGKGALVLGWREDGRVDVFHTPGLALDPEVYGIAGGGLHVMAERPFPGWRLEVGPGGISARFHFRDLEGREVRLEVDESDPRPRRPFSLLAPMGDAAEDPPALPLVYLHGFDFVRRAGSEIRIQVDERRHAPDLLPVPMGGARVTFLRYAAAPFIVTWNPPGEGVLRPARPAADQDGVRWDVEDRQGWIELRAMERVAPASPGTMAGGHRVRVEFEPALPHLAALAPGARVEGAFRIRTDPSTGTVTGSWSVERREDRLELGLRPTGGWTPEESARMVRLMYRIVPTFRAWPTTYRWDATLALVPDPDGNFPLEARWSRER